MNYLFTLVIVLAGLDKVTKLSGQPPATVEQLANGKPDSIAGRLGDSDASI